MEIREVVKATSESSDGGDEDDDDENPEDAAFEIARRRSLLEKYRTEGESFKAQVDVVVAEPTDIEVHEEVIEEELIDYELSPQVVVGIPCDLEIEEVR